MSVTNVLAISGSLRRASINSAFLRAMARNSPQDMDVSIYRGLGLFPLFNPDLEDDTPDVVEYFQRRVTESDVLIVASPEYAHGVTGVMKNALDWLVGLESFSGKPVAILNCSATASHADESLRETLKTMSADIVEPASLKIPLAGIERTEQCMANEPTVVGTIAEIFKALRQHIDTNVH
ncbi:MAG TPA: NADPH-dependent FMN reductase [Oculatellaceae cyanobacterium]